jgi:hypothetical protein
LFAEVYDHKKPPARAKPATPEAFTRRPRIRAAMLWGGHGRDESIAVGCHLAVFIDDVHPAAVVEHNSPPIGIDHLRKDRHVVGILMLPEFYTAGGASRSRPSLRV